MRSWWLVFGGLVACANPPVPHIGGDAGIDGAADAMPDAIGWSIAIDTPQFPADPFTQHAVTVMGAPNTEVSLATDRVHAGALFPQTLVLDGSGRGSATYVACSPAIASCVGSATLQLLLPTATTPVVEASTPITIVDPGTGIGDIGPCSGSDNVMYYRSTDYPHPAWTFQSATSAVWSVLTYPDAARFTIDGAQRLELSLQGIAEPLAAGTYTNTQLSPPTDPGRPAMQLVSDCDGSGRFVIDELTEDPVYGTLQSITVRFDESGCGDQAYTVGCMHYVAPPAPPPATPPLPDPSKVAVTVLSVTGDGTPDPAATAILKDATGAVVLDTTVDSFGFAQAPLIGTGELTIIQHRDAFNEDAHTYRGVHAGDYIVVHPAPITTGASDQMLATWPALPPTVGSVSLFTACSGGTWNGGTGLVQSELTFYDACRTSTFDLLAFADYNDGTPRQWSWQPGNPHVANGNVQLTGAWAPFDTTTITVTNVPANMPSLLASVSMRIGSGLAVMDQLRLDGPPAGDVPFSFKYALAAGDGMVIDVRPVIGFDSPDWITVVTSAASAAVSVDYAAFPVPLLSAVQQSAVGASWTETGTGSVDVRTLFWSATANNQNVQWTIIEPYDGHASSTLPVLPAAHASDDPTTDPSATLRGASVLYRDYDVSSGFTLTAPAPPYRTRQTVAQTH